MYKLNILAPKYFFDLQTPINFLTKRRNFANVREINRRQLQHSSQKRQSLSCPFNIWFAFENNYNQNKQIKNFGSLNVQQKKNKLSIYQSRKELIAQLTKYKQRASSSSPSRKQKRFHNLNCVDQTRNEKIIQYLQTRHSSPYKQSQSMLDDSRQNQTNPTKSQEFHLKRLNSVKPGTIGKLPQLNKQKVKIDSKELERQNSELMNTSINQVSDDKFEPILEKSKVNDLDKQQKKIKQISRNKFLNDSYRLYGLDSNYKGPRSKLETTPVSRYNKTTESKLNSSKEKSKESSQDKEEMKKNTSKEKLTRLLKQSHMKLIEKLSHSPQLSKINKSSRKSEIDFQRDQTIIFSYFPKRNTSGKKK